MYLGFGCLGIWTSKYQDGSKRYVLRDHMGVESKFYVLK